MEEARNISRQLEEQKKENARLREALARKEPVQPPTITVSNDSAALIQKYPQAQLFQLLNEKGTIAVSILNSMTDATRQTLGAFGLLGKQLNDISEQYKSVVGDIKECKHIVKLSDKDKDMVLAEWKGACEQNRKETKAMLSEHSAAIQKVLAGSHTAFDEAAAAHNTALKKMFDEQEQTAQNIYGNLWKQVDAIEKKQVKAVSTILTLTKSWWWIAGALALLYIMTFAVMLVCLVKF